MTESESDMMDLTEAKLKQLQAELAKRCDTSEREQCVICGSPAASAEIERLKARIAELEYDLQVSRDRSKHLKHIIDSRPDPPALMAIVDVQCERLRQVSEEGWTTDHDDAHVRGELALAAVVYAVCDLSGASETVLGLWPWSTESLKASDRRRNLVRAAALIVAEIERVDRALDGKFSRKTAKPAAIDPDMPRRFRYRYIHDRQWIYGVHYPEGCKWTQRNLATVGTKPTQIFEWIDAAPTKESTDATP